MNNVGGCFYAWSDVSFEKRRFALVAVLRLVEKGFINDRNMPTEEGLRDTRRNIAGTSWRPHAECPPWTGVGWVATAAAVATVPRQHEEHPAPGGAKTKAVMKLYI